MSERSDYFFTTLEMFISDGKAPREALESTVESYVDMFFAHKKKQVKIHRLKTWPEYFCLTRSGEKRFDFRDNDRGFKVGDVLKLEEWVPETGEYTGRSIYKKVMYILQDAFGLPEGKCILSLE